MAGDTVTVRGTEVPALGFGTWRLSGRECREAVRDALEIGYRHLDTAVMYGNEHEVGQGLRDSGVPREEVWITTKVLPDDARARDARRSCERSLSELGIDRVDLLLLHWPARGVPLEETLGAFAELRDEGRVRELGVSNFDRELLQQAVELAPVFCDQIAYSPFDAQGAVLDVCLQHDVLCTAYTPLARGRVTRERVIREVAEAHGATPGQVALRWLIDQDHVAAIPKAASPERRRENLGTLDVELTDEDRARIAGLATRG